MAATEKWSERRGASQELTTAGKLVWRAEIVYQVTDAATEADAVAQCPLAMGSDHDVYGSELKVNFIDPQKSGPAGYWTVRFGFSSDAPEAGGTVNTKPRYRWSRNIASEAIDRDFNGNPIVNSVGDPPATHPTNDFRDLVLTYLQWEPVFQLRKSIQYTDAGGAVNSDQFGIFAPEGSLIVYPGECNITSWEPVGEMGIGQAVVQVAYEFRFRARIVVTQASGDDEGAWASAFDFRFPDTATRGWYAETTGTGDDATSVQSRGEWQERTGKLATDAIRLNGKGEPIEDGITVEGKPAISRGIPPGAGLDERFKDNDPGMVFLIYQKCPRLPFKGLIPFFK